jgi:hypothetical protein
VIPLLKFALVALCLGSLRLAWLKSGQYMHAMRKNGGIPIDITDNRQLLKALLDVLLFGIYTVLGLAGLILTIYLRMR